MKVLITAGNTQTPIDKVRCITNVFTGKTGTYLALEAFRRGHEVCFVTSHPEVIRELVPDFSASQDRWQLHAYRTFDELHQLLEKEVRTGDYQTIIHSAAVSDYELAGIYAPQPGIDFDATGGTWNGSTNQSIMMDVQQGKVKSHHAELWLRLRPTMKLIDQIRTPWGFRGLLIKFKLEVDKSPEELMEIAKRSREQSDADLIVANTYEGMHRVAYIGNRSDEFEEVVRMSLPRRLWDRIELLPIAKS